MKLSTSVLNSIQNRWEMQGKASEQTFGLNRIDFGARTMNPLTVVWDRVDIMSEKYTSFSPYNYVLNNPLKLIDPDGLEPKDDYKLFKNGEIKLSKVTDDKTDKLISNSEPSKSIIVEKGLLNKKVVDRDQTATSYNDSQEIFITSNNVDAKKVFEFVAENSKVEFNLATVEKDGKNISILKTSHQTSSVGVAHLEELEKKGFKIITNFHNHPNNDPIPSGYNEKGLAGKQQGGMGYDGDYQNAKYFPNTKQAIYVPSTKKYTFYDKNKAYIPK